MPIGTNDPRFAFLKAIYGWSACESTHSVTAINGQTISEPMAWEQKCVPLPFVVGDLLPLSSAKFSVMYTKCVGNLQDRGLVTITEDVHQLDFAVNRDVTSFTYSTGRGYAVDVRYDDAYVTLSVTCMHVTTTASASGFPQKLCNVTFKSDKEEFAMWRVDDPIPGFGLAPNGYHEVERIDRDEGARDVLVTLTQVAGLIAKSKRTVESWWLDGRIPKPDEIGGDGIANRWRWSRIRPALEGIMGRDLPSRFPTSEPY